MDKVAVMATGRSDYPNQINNVLAFPGVLRGSAGLSSPGHYDLHVSGGGPMRSQTSSVPRTSNAECIIPSVFDERVSTAVASAVKHACAGGWGS